MKISTLLSPRHLIEQVKIVFRRYPVALTFLTALTVFLVCDINGRTFDNSMINTAFEWSSGMGFGLSLAVSQWCRRLDAMRFDKPFQAVTVGLAAVSFLMIALFGNDSRSEELARTAIACALAAAVIFGPDSGKKNFELSYHYTLGVTGALLASYALGIVLTIATCITWVTTEILFSCQSDKFFLSLIIILGGFVPGILFLRRLPQEAPSDALTSGDITIGKIFRNVILAPLCIYMAILYVYAVKIVITGSLPKGQISTIVTFCTVLVLVTLYFMQPLVATGDRFARISRRVLPPLLLPLIALMAYGLTYRMIQYGPTASRVYVALFVVWAVGATVCLIIQKQARFNLLAMSFAVGFFVVSSLPWLNVSTLTDIYIHHQLEKTFSGQRLPMNLEQLRAVLAQMPRKEGELAASRLEYLDSWNNHSKVSDLVVDENRLSVYRTLENIYDSTFYPTVTYNDEVEIPAGFKRVREFSKSEFGKMPASEGETVCIFANEKGSRVGVDNTILSGITRSQTARPITITVSADTVVVITSVEPNYSDADDIQRISGYLFTK